MSFHEIEEIELPSNGNVQEEVETVEQSPKKIKNISTKNLTPSMIKELKEVK